MSTFVNDKLSGTLADLRGRRAQIEPFLQEAAELDKAIRETEKLCKKLGIAQTGGPKPARTLTEAPQRTPAPDKDGTNAERALKLLRSHPRGLNTSVIARQADIAQGSVSVVLADLERAGEVVKVGRGFWRIADGQADAA